MKYIIYIFYLEIIAIFSDLPVSFLSRRLFGAIFQQATPAFALEVARWYGFC